jgi:hypothetical protein
LSSPILHADPIPVRRVPVTRELLCRLRSLDDLLELTSALGYAPQADELNVEAQQRLGLAVPALGIRRSAIVGRAGSLAVYGVLADDPSRSAVAAATGRLAQATAGQQHLLLALDAAATTLVVATAPGAEGTRAVRQLRVSLRDPSPVAIEIVQGLTVRPREPALAHAARIAQTLEEEGLTRRFFREFQRLHGHAASSLTGVPRATDAERRDLALVSLTRLLFLYFVQAKGWLAGRSDFLPSLLDTALGRGHPFHRRVFEPLCFGALNVPARARTAIARALGEVPFLNGGLFQRHPLERRFPDAGLPNATWRTLFDELFERFHFTVREDGDGDAVDPEMLGRVFEGLMAASTRRNAGTYFTPRALVREIVERAIGDARAGPAPRPVERLRVLDPAVGSGAFLLEALHQLERARGVLQPGETMATRRRAIVRDNLFGVDTNPMAVRLAELRLWLAMVVDDAAAPADVAPLPNLDWNVRQGDSLLSPLDVPDWGAAVALRRPPAVAERKARYYAASGREKVALGRSIRGDECRWALDTIDASIRSLGGRIADDGAASGCDLFGVRAVRPLPNRARAAAWRRKRRELVALRRRVSEDDALPFFSYDIHFGEAHADGGFDIVVGNPPWVRGEVLPLTLRTALSVRYASWRASAGRKGFAHLPDLSVAFVERALELTRPGGIIALLLPSKLLRAGYATRLRALLRRRSTILGISDRAHSARSGFDATVFPMLLVVRREEPEPDARAEITVCAAGRSIHGAAAQRDLAIDDAVPGSPWLALPSDLVQAIRSALRCGPALHSRFRPALGVKTGANDVFVRPLDRADELPASCRTPAILGRDVRPFVLSPSAALLAAVDRRGVPLTDPPPDVLAYLAPYASRLARRVDARLGRCPSWELFRTDLLRAEWIVVWRDIAPRVEAALLHRSEACDPVPLNTCYGVAAPDEATGECLVAYLNSRLIRSLAAAIAERASGGAYRFSAATIGALPLPSDLDSQSCRILESIGREAARGEPHDADDLDTHAARALGLDADTTARLAFIGDALCGDSGGHR